MRNKRRVAAAAFFLLLAAAGQERAGQAAFFGDDSSKNWKEIEAQLPPYPKPENMVQLEASPVSGNRFYVDSASIGVGSDGVVRYTVVIKTSGGATDVSFEGIRCETRQQKYYAIGHRNGTWSRTRNPQWRRIEPKDINNYQSVLYADYFCDGKMPVRNAGAAVDALKYDRPNPRSNLRD